MGVEMHRIAVLTSAGGAFTGYTPPLFGRLEWVRYVPHDSAPLDTGANLDIVGETSGVVVANHDSIGTNAFTAAYRQALHSVAGVAAVYADAGEGVLGKIALGGERLQLDIASGGNAKRGEFFICVSH